MPSVEEDQLDGGVEVQSGADALDCSSIQSIPEVVSNQGEPSSAPSRWPKATTCLWVGGAVVGASILGYLVYRACTK